MEQFYINEDDLPIIYEKGKKKAVIIDYEKFKELLQKLRKKRARKGEDPLLKVIGICEGPSDLAKNHDKYIYGSK